MVYNKDGYFIWVKPDQVFPKDVIQLTVLQIQAINEIIEVLTIKDGEEAKLALKYGIQ